MQILVDPVERLQIAQPALAFLDVGFDDIALTALLFVTLVRSASLASMNSEPVLRNRSVRSFLLQVFGQ